MLSGQRPRCQYNVWCSYFYWSLSKRTSAKNSLGRIVGIQRRGKIIQLLLTHASVRCLTNINKISLNSRLVINHICCIAPHARHASHGGERNQNHCISDLPELLIVYQTKHSGAHSSPKFHRNRMNVSMLNEQSSDDEETVDVRSLPLKPPQPLLPPEKPVRRAWHPIMWDEKKDTAPNTAQMEQEQLQSHEYPHTQRIRNLRRLIAEGKVKPESETLIFFLCNKFAVSDDRRRKFD